MKNLAYATGVLLFVGTLAACDPSSKSTENKKIVSIASIHNKGVNIALTDTGKGDTTLLFVHGWAINKGYWSNQIDYFAKYYRIVAIDLPGFGQSGKSRDNWSTAEYASDVDSVIAQLNLKRVILVGHSMAGDIVLQAAIENPGKVIAVVGVDNFKNVGAPNTSQSKKEFEDAINQIKHNFKGITTAWFNQSLFSKTTSRAIKERILGDVGRSDTTIAVKALAQGEGFDELTKLKQYGKKLYLINSDVHPVATKKMDAEEIHYMILYTKGTGHFSFIETPDDFNKDLEEVIADTKNEQ